MHTNTAADSPRLLQPSTDYFFHEGAALARLSPHKSLKNAAIIYESIKNLPNKTLVRDDFDKKSHPFIFFPERAKKKIGQSTNTIEAKNIDACRREMANFLSSIAIEGIRHKASSSSIHKAVLLLNKTVSSTIGDQRDFTVGDIKESLRILTKAYYIDEVRKKTSPHRLLDRQVTKIQNKRLREFVSISKEVGSDICVALRNNLIKKYDVRPEISLFAIKIMIKDFLNQDAKSSKSFASFIRQHADDPDIDFFAERWLAITLPKMTDERIQFSTESWAKELDRVCEIIVKSNRRSMQCKPASTTNSGGAGALLQRRESKTLGLPRPTTLVYSSLKSEDTDDSSSFPSPPRPVAQSRSASTVLLSDAGFIPTQGSAQSQKSLPPVFPQQQVSGYFSNASDQDEMNSAQSTLSPVDGNKSGSTFREKFGYQSLVTSRGFLPLQEADESLKQSELDPLLSEVSQEDVHPRVASSGTEQKM